MLLTFWILCRYREVGTGPAKRERILLLLWRRFLYLMLTIEEVDFEFWTFWKTSRNKNFELLNNCFDFLQDLLLIDLTMNCWLGLLCWQVQDWCCKNIAESKWSLTPISIGTIQIYMNKCSCSRTENEIIGLPTNNENR